MRSHSIYLYVAALTPLLVYSSAIGSRAPSWSYMGCYTDSLAPHTLSKDSWFSADNMTIGNCQTFCSDGGYLFAGLGYGSQCFCDVNILASAKLSDASSCTMDCSGNKQETCGGRERLSIYTTGAVSPNMIPVPIASSTPKESAVISGTSSALPIASSTKVPKLTSRKLNSTRQSELVVNGDFLVGAGWSLTSDPHGLSSTALSGQYLFDDQGNHAYSISSDPYRSSRRSLCISQSFTYPKTGVFSFTSEIGRSIPASEGSTWSGKLGYAIFVDDNLMLSNQTCNPSTHGCASSGPFGNYSVVTAHIRASYADYKARNHDLRVCAVFTTWVNTDVMDSFFVQKVSLFGPHGHD